MLEMGYSDKIEDEKGKFRRKWKWINLMRLEELLLYALDLS